jgi:hypothetical protein
MSTPANPVAVKRETIGAKLRDILVGAGFATVLLVPKLLHLRNNRRAWYAFRVMLGVSGASLVVLPVGLSNNYYLAVCGLVLFIAAILLPPAKHSYNMDAKARELGALVVVNGGRYQSSNEPASLVQLFVASDHVWVLDPHPRPLLVIPTNEISSIRVEETKKGWLLRIEWTAKFAEFSYRGAFAEHLARVAETTLQNVIRPTLPVIPKSRAASA